MLQRHETLSRRRKDLGRWSGYGCVPTLERGNEPSLALPILRVYLFFDLLSRECQVVSGEW
ncbi:hypothetical protein [Candidatus Thiosymbion oneisti]|uniref:hypothetical protein n=1 Tax=Candidatus Thiosymbion oneisti TaxID=589554 RepID=UPI001060ED93|nr:hypothetical protein [Candidatus Thiosymbion oneisti]